MHNIGWLNLAAPGLRQPTSEPAHLSAEPPVEDDELEFSLDPSIGQAVKAGISAERAWGTALEQLQLEVPRTVFSEYLARAYLASYDSTTGAFTIAAPNAYTRDWLQSRLAATLARMLTGICYQGVEVHFVVRGEQMIPD